MDGKLFDAPGIITVKKNGEKTKVLSALSDDCVTQIALNREIESVFFANILSGGALGSSTDYGTDKMWKYQDNVAVSCKAN